MFIDSIGVDTLVLSELQTLLDSFGEALCGGIAGGAVTATSLLSFSCLSAEPGLMLAPSFVDVDASCGESVEFDEIGVLCDRGTVVETGSFSRSWFSCSG